MDEVVFVEYQHFLNLILMLISIKNEKDYQILLPLLMYLDLSVILIDILGWLQLPLNVPKA